MKRGQSRWPSRCAAGALVAALSGCAAPRPSSEGQGAMATMRDKGMSAQDAARTVAVGASTKPQLLAALGPATVVQFDSGYEVWAWRAETPGNPEAGTEFVVLFSPAGVAVKTRIRPPYPKP